MGNLLYIIAVILVIGWAIGFFGYHAGSIVHILLVIAIIAVILGCLEKKGFVKNHSSLYAYFHSNLQKSANTSDVTHVLERRKFPLLGFRGRAK